MLYRILTKLYKFSQASYRSRVNLYTLVNGALFVCWQWGLTVQGKRTVQLVRAAYKRDEFKIGETLSWMNKIFF